MSMKEGVKKTKEFKTKYKKIGKHRKKCLVCGKLIEDGYEVVCQQWIKTKYYPVKGLMGFSVWKFIHVECFDNNTNKDLV